MQTSTNLLKPLRHYTVSEVSSVLGLQPQSWLIDAPNLPGIYMLFNKTGGMIYVGKASNLNRRLNEHFGSTGDNPFISLLTQAYVWKTTLTVKYAELLERRIHDGFCQKYGRPPVANRITPPGEKLLTKKRLPISKLYKFPSPFSGLSSVAVNKTRPSSFMNLKSSLSSPIKSSAFSSLYKNKPRYSYESPNLMAQILTGRLGKIS